MDQKLVREIFDYDPDGYLVWRTKNRGRKIGSRAGSFNASGYRMISIGRSPGNRQLVPKRQWRAHRLIFLWHHGYIPEILDHVNGIKSDNRIENLRPANLTENNRNRKPQPNSTSKYLGVSWDRRLKRWVARIGKKHLGCFKDEDDAARAYDAASKRIYGEFANPNFS